jgi:hypothetical protein
MNSFLNGILLATHVCMSLSVSTLINWIKSVGNLTGGFFILRADNSRNDYLGMKEKSIAFTNSREETTRLLPCSWICKKLDKIYCP